jgi:deoxyribose-phosphate aldolase
VVDHRALVEAVRADLREAGVLRAPRPRRTRKGRAARKGITNAQVAARIDHTLLKPEAGADDIARLCDEAVEHGFATVCVNPVWVSEAVGRLDGRVPVCTTAGFPLGAHQTETKVTEARFFNDAATTEIYTVLQVGWVRAGMPERAGRKPDARLLKAARADVAAVARAVNRRKGRLLKVILETGALSKRQVVAAALICEDAGTDFVKTCTGFGPRGATVGDVRLLAETVSPSTLIKASAGIRTGRQARALVTAGADRLGCSASLAVLGL